ncbi:hypothetical protein DFH09DRAFT_1507748 [Mycena vulgaris]|nr:hypothetical protein DFH09DRAFT_1507748 [Mycena vulgaris]
MEPTEETIRELMKEQLTQFVSYFSSIAPMIHLKTTPAARRPPFCSRGILGGTSNDYEEARKIFGVYCRIPAIGLGAGMAKCLWRANQIELCEEINSLHRVNYHEADPPLRNWRNWMLDIPELSFLVLSGLCLASEIFASLDNSGTAAMRRWTAHEHPVQDIGRCVKFLETRRPDPGAAPNAGVTVPALQVRGSWTRLQGKP